MGYVVSMVPPYQIAKSGILIPVQLLEAWRNQAGTVVSKGCKVFATSRKPPKLMDGHRRRVTDRQKREWEEATEVRKVGKREKSDQSGTKPGREKQGGGTEPSMTQRREQFKSPKEKKTTKAILQTEHKEWRTQRHINTDRSLRATNSFDASHTKLERRPKKKSWTETRWKGSDTRRGLN